MTHVQFLKFNHNNPPEIRQSRIKRDWMDATYKKHAYQCLPVTTANVYGWEFVLEQDLVVQLDEPNSMVRILSGQMTEHERRQASATTLEMVTFHLGWALKTEPNYSTWLTGSPNYFHPDADPLSASIPSSWWIDPIDMNWRIRTIGKPVTFHAGEPFCFVNIYDNTVMGDLTISVGNWSDNKQLVEQRAKYSNLKQRNNVLKPWTWTRGIRTGLDADGNRIGPPTNGLPKINTPIM